VFESNQEWNGTGRAFSLDEDVALVTGGGTGLGFAIAKALRDFGARVVIAGRREAVLQRAVESLGKGVTYEVHDVVDVDSAPAFANEIAAGAGPITILVNNAGVHLKKPAEDTTAREFQGILETHVMGSFGLSAAVIPYMRQAGHGSILFMASMTSLIGMPNAIAYSAAKSAYLGMVRTLASELSSGGIRVNAIAPGWIETPMLHKALAGDSARKNRILERTPMNRFGQPEDVAWAAAFLCSPASRFITGVVLPVDGGASIGF
jgi:NAD(P)-dependent dehydrogenase (short-subunit alcohol dehydrogenase family)